MGGAVVLIAFLPWLDKSPVKSIRYRSTKFKVMVTLFIIAFIGWASWAPCCPPMCAP